MLALISTREAGDLKRADCRRCVSLASRQTRERRSGAPALRQPSTRLAAATRFPRWLRSTFLLSADGVGADAP
jgi:hypothetical protein